MTGLRLWLRMISYTGLAAKLRPDESRGEPLPPPGAAGRARVRGRLLPHPTEVRGSRPSRRPSPMRLKAITVQKMARPGKTDIHQAEKT